MQKSGCFLLLCMLFLIGCDNFHGPNQHKTGQDTTNNTTPASLTIQPRAVRIETGGQQQFYSALSGVSNKTVLFSLEPSVGTINSEGLYTAPSIIATDSLVVKLVVSSVEKPTLKDTATIVLLRASSPELCYSRDIAPIISNNCTMCHNQNPLPGEDDIVDLRSYNGLMPYVRAGNPAESKLYKVLIHARPDKEAMPPDKALDAATIDIIRRWILEGAKNGDCSGNGQPCDTTSVSYTATVEPLLKTQCLGCHATQVSLQYGGGVNLEGYDNVLKQGTNGKLVGVVSYTPGFRPMPQGGTKLPDCSIAQLRAWVNKGMPR